MKIHDKRVLDFLERNMFWGTLFCNGMIEVNQNYSICFIFGERKEWLEVDSRKLFSAAKERILLDKLSPGCQKKRARL